MTDRPEIDHTISWVYTNNIEATCRFYSDVLGLEQTRDAGVARIYKLSTTAYVGVCEALDWRVVEPRGGMLTIVTPDVDGWYARLQEAGAPCQSAPRKIDKFGIYAFVAEDPNGYLIEFQQFLD